jgi:hypothetical protein
LQLTGAITSEASRLSACSDLLIAAVNAHIAPTARS